jgi:hypothetical protein
MERRGEKKRPAAEDAVSSPQEMKRLSASTIKGAQRISIDKALLRISFFKTFRNTLATHEQHDRQGLAQD